MRISSFVILLAAASGVWADPRVVFSGQKFIREKQDNVAPTPLSERGYSDLIFTLLGIKSDAPVALTSAQQVLQCAKKATALQ
jgi:hypothetical protein